MAVDRKNRDAEIMRDFLAGVRRRCPDHLPVLEALGDLYTRMHQYEEGLEIDIELTTRDPGNAMYWYNLACSLALTGDAPGALDALNRAVDLGYDDPEWMRTDEDLESLRSLPAFQDLLQRAAVRASES